MFKFFSWVLGTQDSLYFYSLKYRGAFYIFFWCLRYIYNLKI